MTLRFDEETMVLESYEVARMMQSWQGLQPSYVFCDKRFCKQLFVASVFTHFCDHYNLLPVFSHTFDS